MVNEITRLHNAQMLVTEKRKNLEDARLVTIAAVKAEANLKSEFIDALNLLKREMEAMNEFDLSTAATKVIEHAKAADEALRQIAEDTEKSALPQTLAESKELALGILDDARIVALEMLEVARQAALKLSSGSSARELELIALTDSPPAPAQFRFIPSV